MGGVAGELPDLAKRGVQPADHVVEGAGQPTDFVARLRHGEPLAEIACRNPLSRQSDGIHGPKGATGEKPSAGQRDGQGDGHGNGEQNQKPMQGVLDRFHGGADLHDIEQVSSIDDWNGDQAERRFVGILGRLKNREPFERRFKRRPAEGDLMLLDVGGSNGNGAGGAENLKKLIDARQFWKLREQFFFIDERQKPPFF